MDADWSMEYLSEGCLQLTGYEPARFIGNAVHSWGSLIEKDDYVTALQEVQNQLADDTQYSVQYRITLPDGELRWVSERAVGVAGKNPNQQIIQAFTDPNTKQFDRNQVIKFLKDLPNRDETVQRQWKGFEDGLRDERIAEKYQIGRAHV